jgi:hypothetical protein
MERLNLVVLMMVTGLSLVIYLILYRLYYHPLVQFPGPVLARATYAYEWYYDLVLGGQYTFKLRELHARYGSVIRLNPDELHFDDPDYYDEIFNITNGEAEKPYRVANVFGPYPAVLAFAFSNLHLLGLKLTLNQAIGTQGHHLHRIRRGALNPFFSKRSVLDLVPFIQTHIDRLCARFDAASKSAEPIDLKYCFAAVTLDIMNEYCFSKDSLTTMKPDFGRKSFEDIDSFLEISLLVSARGVPGFNRDSPCYCSRTLSLLN